MYDKVLTNIKGEPLIAITIKDGKQIEKQITVKDMLETFVDNFRVANLPLKKIKLAFGVADKVEKEKTNYTKNELLFILQGLLTIQGIKLNAVYSLAKIFKEEFSDYSKDIDGLLFEEED